MNNAYNRRHMTGRRLIDANDQVLWRLSVVMPDGHRYVPWEAIAEVPTAETAKNGHRVEYKPVHYRCSACGFEMGGVVYSYCPNCGAKTKGETQDDQRRSGGDS